MTTCYGDGKKIPDETEIDRPGNEVYFQDLGSLYEENGNYQRISYFVGTIEEKKRYLLSPENHSR